MKDKQQQQLNRARKQVSIVQAQLFTDFHHPFNLHQPQLTNEIAIMKQVTHVNAVQLYEVVVRTALCKIYFLITESSQIYHGVLATRSTYIYYYGVCSRVSEAI